MTTRRFATALVPLAVAALTAVACGGGGSNPQTLQPGRQPTTHQVSDNSRGTTVQAHLGDDIAVTLHSTYWQLGAPSGNVLVQSGAPTSDAGGPSCSPVPGSGCGTVHADYRVARAGTTEIKASRTSCGEAMRCTGDQGTWSVTVVASR